MFKSKKGWFVPKPYGYGLVPVTWQGWMMTLVLIILIFASAYANGILDAGFYEATDKNMFNRSLVGFWIDMILLIGVFLFFAEKKTVGEIKWNWGKK